MKIATFPNGMTVAELKAVVAEWPDTDEDGQPCEVWIGGGADVSNQARAVWPLNAFTGEGGTKSADLLIDLA